LNKKLDELERRRRIREGRIRRMTPEELAEFMRRSKAMKPRTLAERAQRKRDRALREELARLEDYKATLTPERMALMAERERLEALATKLQPTEGTEDDRG